MGSCATELSSAYGPSWLIRSNAGFGDFLVVQLLFLKKTKPTKYWKDWFQPLEALQDTNKHHKEDFFSKTQACRSIWPQKIWKCTNHRKFMCWQLFQLDLFWYFGLVLQFSRLVGDARFWFGNGSLDRRVDHFLFLQILWHWRRIFSNCWLVSVYAEPVTCKSYAQCSTFAIAFRSAEIAHCSLKFCDSQWKTSSTQVQEIASQNSAEMYPMPTTFPLSNSAFITGDTKRHLLLMVTSTGTLGSGAVIISCRSSSFSSWKWTSRPPPLACRNGRYSWLWNPYSGWQIKRFHLGENRRWEKTKSRLFCANWRKQTSIFLTFSALSKSLVFSFRRFACCVNFEASWKWKTLASFCFFSGKGIHLQDDRVAKQMFMCTTHGRSLPDLYEMLQFVRDIDS